MKKLPAGFSVVAVRAMGAAATVAAMAVMVARFGIGKELDAYFWAWTAPQLVAAAVSFSIAGALLPGLYEALKEHGRDFMYECLGPLFCRYLLVLLAIAGATAGAVAYAQYALGYAIGPAFGMMPWLFAAVGLNGAARVLAAALRIRGKTSGYAAMPLLTAVGIVVGVLVLGDRLGPLSAAVGCALGGAGNIALMLVVCMGDGFRPRVTFRGRDDARALMEEAHRPAGTGLGIEADVIIERLLGTLLGPGCVAALGVTGSVARAVKAVPAGAAGAFVEPALIELTDDEGHEAVTGLVRGALRRMASLFLPATIAMALVAVPLSRVLFAGQGDWAALLGWMLAARVGVAFFGATTNLLVLIPEQMHHLGASAKVLEPTAAARAVVMSGLAVSFGVVGVACGFAIAEVVSVTLALAITSRVGCPVLSRAGGSGSG